MVFAGAGRGLETWQCEVEDPRPGEVLLRTQIAGVCGTDAHRLAGDLPDPGYPVTFGHEGIGVIDALGDGVTTDHRGVPVAPGDVVYWTPSSDRAGAVPSTGWPPPAEIPNPAAYQDHPTLPSTNVFYRVPDDTSPEHVIAFGCAMPTAFGGVGRLGGITPGHNVVIQGCGPVGLASTVLCASSAAHHVIVIGEPGDRRRAAERLGATTTIPFESTTADERREQILDLTDGRGADVVIEAAGHISAFDEGLSLLADEGRYLILGLYSGSGTVPFNPVPINNRSLAIIGSMGPARFADYHATIGLAQRLGDRLSFADLITHRFPLSQLQDAIAAAGSGDAIKAIVIPGVAET